MLHRSLWTVQQLRGVAGRWADPRASCLAEPALGAAVESSKHFGHVRAEQPGFATTRIPWAFENQAMEVLLFLAHHEEEELPRSKVLYALSCLTRGHDQSTSYFLAHEGMQVLREALNRHPCARDQNRALFITRNLCARHPEVLDLLSASPMLADLVQYASVTNGDELMRESVLGAFEEMASTSLTFWQVCKRDWYRCCVRSLKESSRETDRRAGGG